MLPLKYIPQVSFGNFITIGIFVVGLAVTWGEMASQIKSLDAHRTKAEARIEEIARINNQEVRAAEISIHQLQISHERIVERLEGIKTSIDRIEKKMP